MKGGQISEQAQEILYQEEQAVQGCIHPTHI